MKIGIITSNSLRHNYFVNSLANYFEIDFVIREPKVFDPSNVYKNEYEKELLKEYFQQREISEQEFFRHEQNIKVDRSKIFNIETGSINDREVLEYVGSFNNTVICVFGSSILKDGYFALKDRFLINMHLGLSPYYRGSGTNFFPFVENELACIGATIHKLSNIIDGGEIIHQARPEIQVNDSIHDIGNKTIIAGTEKMIIAVKEYVNSTLRLYEFDIASGKLYKRKDFSADKVKIALENLKSGIIKQFLSKKLELYSKYPIID